MNRATIIGTAVLAAALTAVGGYWIGRETGPKATSAHDAGGKAARKVLYWHDPMVPGQRFDKPGKSPFMDMDLVPVYADEGSEGVKIEPSVTQNLGLRTVTVARQRFASSVETPAVVTIPEGNDVLLQARVSGTVTRVHVSGSFVAIREGDALLTMSSPELLAALNEYQVLAAAPSSELQQLRVAAVTRLRILGVDDGTIAKAERGQAPNLTLVQRAPASGIVRELAVRTGMTVSPGQTLARISPLSPIWVEAAVPETSAGGIHTGDSATISAPGLTEATITGKVVAVLPSVDPVARTRGVRIEFANRDAILVPGMTARVRFEAEHGEPVLAVPDEAIIRTGTRALVYVASTDGSYVPTEIETGRTLEGRTEVPSGLNEGATVVTSAQFLVDSESNLRAANERRQPPAPPKPSALSAGYEAVGVLTAVQPDAATLRHGAVPALGWPAMTMTFGLAPGVKPPGPVGTDVRFRFRMDGGKPVITSMQTAPGASP
ncbi:MAG: efflux RND transporter periplasmic adaptor subunit [Sphingomonadales bacterium]